MDNERFVKPEVEDRPIAWLKKHIEKAFEGEPLSWKEAEPEVVCEKLHSTGVVVTPLLLAKVRILKYIQEHSVGELLEDPARIIYSAELLNNEASCLTDTEFLPHLTTLELAYFIEEMKSLGGLDKPENAPLEFRKVCAYVLSEEGCYEPPYPFTFISKNDLYPEHFPAHEIPETDKELQAKKQEAVDTYLRLMRKLAA